MRKWIGLLVAAGCLVALFIPTLVNANGGGNPEADKHPGKAPGCKAPGEHTFPQAKLLPNPRRTPDLGVILKGQNVVSPQGDLRSGDLNGRGEASVTATGRGWLVCFKIKVRLSKSGDFPIQARIHLGKAGENGPVVAVLFPNRNVFKASKDSPVIYSSKRCISRDKPFLRKFFKSPSSYYLEVRSKEFPLGALRGQFHKS